MAPRAPSVFCAASPCTALPAIGSRHGPAAACSQLRTCDRHCEWESADRADSHCLLCRGNRLVAAGLSNRSVRRAPADCLAPRPTAQRPGCALGRAIQQSRWVVVADMTMKWGNRRCGSATRERSCRTRSRPASTARPSRASVAVPAESLRRRQLTSKVTYEQ